MSTMQSYATESSCLCGDICLHWGTCTVMHTTHHMPSHHRSCVASAPSLASGIGACARERLQGNLMNNVGKIGWSAAN